MTQALDELPGQHRSGDAILKTFVHDDLQWAMQFVNRVADAAEPANHHPGIQIRWNQVTRPHQPRRRWADERRHQPRATGYSDWSGTITTR